MSHTQPKIIYVTAWKKDKTASLVEQAVLAGFRAIDTACQPKHYDERGVGEALARLIARGLDRKSLFVQTKFTPIGGQDPARVPYDRRASLATQVAQSFRMSQQNLGMEYVDSLVLHSPLAHHEELMEVWEAMEAIAKDGGAKKLGISNCYDFNYDMGWKENYNCNYEATFANGAGCKSFGYGRFFGADYSFFRG